MALSFSYNPAGQIASQTRDNDLYVWGGHYNRDVAEAANGLNQLTVQGDTGIGYDAGGNVTSIGGAGYGYTSENRLATAPGGYVMTHDPLGRYHWIASGGPVTRMQYDGANLIEERDANGVARRYVHGPGVDEPLVWYEGSGTSDRRWLHADERGSIVAVTNASGVATSINSYDEYGVPAAGNVGRFQYTGQAWLPEISMYYYKARMYAPGLGRFLQADPIGYGDGLNIYGYVAGDSVNFVDPGGLGSWVARTNCSGWEPGTCWTTWNYVLDAGELSQIGGNAGLTLTPIGEGGGGIGGVSPDGAPKPAETSEKEKQRCTPRQSVNSRHYPIPPGYSRYPAPANASNRLVRNGAGRLVNNPLWDAARARSEGVQWGDAAMDLALIGGSSVLGAAGAATITAGAVTSGDVAMGAGGALLAGLQAHKDTKHEIKEARR